MIVSDPYMKIKFLTPYDQMQYDPTGRIRQMLQHFKVDVQTFGPKNPICKNLNSESFTDYLSLLQKNTTLLKAHSSYIDFNNGYIEKAGPQGGVFPMSIIEESYLASYHNAHTDREFNYSKLGAQWLAEYITKLIDTNDIDVMSYASPVKYCDTNAAIPTGGKKGNFLSETIGFTNWRHLLPNVPGERYMRKKCRTINQDACANVRYIENELSAVRNFLKTYIPELFGSWLNPNQVIKPTATTIVDSNMYSVETDYEHMDEHYSYEVVINTVLPIYRACLAKHPGNLWRLEQYIEEMFDQPIYFGDYMYTGRHCLLSGQGPTNDFETNTQVSQAVGVLLIMGLNPLAIHQLHIGDDMVVAFKKLSHAQQFWDLFIKESNANGLIINTAKSVIRHGECQYCRKLYYPRGKRELINGVYTLIGAYPTILALNSIINPERLCKSEGVNAVATYQRLDNAYGSPDFAYLVQYVSSRIKLRDIQFTTDDIVQYSNTDWWAKLYGEPWDPMVSPSFKLVHNLT